MAPIPEMPPRGDFEFASVWFDIKPLPAAPGLGAGTTSNGGVFDRYVVVSAPGCNWNGGYLRDVNL